MSKKIKVDGVTSVDTAKPFALRMYVNSAGKYEQKDMVFDGKMSDAEISETETLIATLGKSLKDFKNAELFSLYQFNKWKGDDFDANEKPKFMKVLNPLAFMKNGLKLNN